MRSVIKDSVQYIFKHKIILLLVLAGWVLTLLPSVFDGHTGCINGKCGYIIGTNYRDGIWYLAVAATAFKTIPFRMPNYAGAPLQGYHFLPNLLSYILSFVGIPITLSFYQIFPIVYIILLTLVSVYLARKIKDDARFVFCFLFFVYFGVPFTLFTSLYHFGYLKNSLIINTFQTTRILESIHAAFAYVILLVTMAILYSKKITRKNRIILGILIFLLFGIKFYTAAIILFMLFIYDTLTLIQDRKIAPYILNGLIYVAAAAAGILLFYNPFIAFSNGPIFTFAPFATVHHIIESKDYIYLPRLVLARYFLYAHGWGPRLVAIELFSTFLYVVFYLGTRVVGFFYLAKIIWKRTMTKIELTLFLSSLFGFLMSILVIQRGDWFNPMQFAVYACLIMNYFAAKFVLDLIKSKKMIAFFLAAVIIIVTLPSNLVNLGYLQNPARYVIPKEEMTALAFLKKLPDGSVFLPIYVPDSDYVSAFTGKPTYYNYVILVDNSGINSVARKKLVSNTDFDTNKLDVKYVYLPKIYDHYASFVVKFSSNAAYKKIYHNSQVTIFEKK